MTPGSQPSVAAGIADAPIPAPVIPSLTQRLVRGSAIYGIATFALKGLSFFLVALYTRFLTPADYGVIALAETVAVVVATMSGLGIDGAGRRLYFQYASDRRLLDGYVSSILRFGAMATASVTAAAMLAGPFLMRLLGPRFAIPFFPYVAIALGTAAASQLLDYRLGLYQTESKPRQYAWVSTASVLTTASFVIALVIFARRGAIGMLEGKLIAALAMAAVAVVLSWPRVQSGLSWRYVKETLPLALPLVPHQFMALGLVVADRFILQRYRDLSEVGVYSLAYTFGMTMYLVATSVMQAWSPLFFETAEQGDQGRDTLGRLSYLLAVFLSAVAVIGIAVARPFVRFVISSQYREAGALIPWIIASYLMHSLFTLFQLAALQGKRSTRIWAASMVALAANLVLNILLIPPLGAYGAAYATLAAYAAEALLMYAYAQRTYRVHYRVGRIVLAVAVVGAVLAGSQWVPGQRLLVWNVALLGTGLLLLWHIAGLRRAELKNWFSHLRSSSSH